MDDDVSVAYTYESADSCGEGSSLAETLPSLPAHNAEVLHPHDVPSNEKRRTVPGVRVGNMMMVKEEDV